MKYILFCLFAMVSTGYSNAVVAADHMPWTAQASVYNVHYRPSKEHLRYSPLLALEYERDGRGLMGAALFRNSFGQFSQLAYVGKRYPIAKSDFYGKWVAGLLHGYRGPYRHKVPYNHGGFSPALLPSVGYRHDALQFETQFFWTNGLMITAGYAWR